MWYLSPLGARNPGPFRSRIRSGRSSPRRRWNLEALEERTLLSTVALFDPLNQADITVSPFPSNRFTIPDVNQNTGRRVSLPLPNQTANPSDYQDTLVINELDGFNLQPRLSIPFDGSIDPKSVSSANVFLVSMGDTLPGGDRGGEVVGINQIVWDPASRTLHVESDELLDQHTRYGLIVTSGVRDAAGRSVQASEEFARFQRDLNFGQTKDPELKAYRKDLIDAMSLAASRAGVPVSQIVTASVFTTQSVTATLEKIRNQIHEGLEQAPRTATFLLGPGGSRTLFNLSEVTGIKLNQQTKVSGPLTSVPVDLNALRVIPGAVNQVAFGKYVSPNYENAEQYIPAVGTRNTSAIQGYNDIYFTVYLPSGPEPERGWPVMIWGHGGGGNKDGQFGLPIVAATMADQGVATIAINAVGSGYGPLGTITVTSSGDSSSVTLPAGGRGIDQDLPDTPGYGIIGASEGFGTRVTSDHAIVSTRDGRIQTVADLMQLVRVIAAGVDVDGNGSTDLNADRISYAGISMGTWYGAPFLAVEPDVKAAVLSSLGGPEIERRLGVNRSGPSGILTAAALLASRTPSLINNIDPARAVSV